MARGRKPLPTKVKENAGNPGKRALNKNEPKPGKLADLPKPKTKMKKAGVEHYYRVGRMLIEQGVLTPWDLDLLESYARNWELALTAWERMTKHGKNYTKATPNGHEQSSAWVTIYRNADRAMRDAGASLGLDPSSRSRLGVRPESDFEKEKAEEFFEGHGARVLKVGE